jgi:hypothetical protein
VSRRQRSRRATTRTVRIGLGCVLVLVAALPFALALVGAQTIGHDAGMGSGDLCAAALSALDRDLHSNRALPPAAQDAARAFLALPAPAPLPGADEHPLAAAGQAEPAWPACCTAGPTDAPHPLLR